MARVFRGVSLAELVVEDAQELASQLATRDESTKSQMRRFYQEYVRLRQGIPKGDEDAYLSHEVALKMLIAKVAYASARKAAKMDIVFKKWLEDNIKAITCSTDVHTFGDYYEAFIGFFYAAQPVDNRAQAGNDRPQGGYQGNNRNNRR